MKTFEMVVPFLRRSKWTIIKGLLVLVLVDACQLVIPKIMQYTVDEIGKPGFTQKDILIYSLIILAMAAGIAGLRYLWRILIIGNSWQMDRDLRQTYYNHLLKQSQNFFNASKIGDLMAYAINDLNAVRMLLGMGFIAGADIILMSVSSLGFMIAISPRLTFLSILPLPLLSFMIAYFGARMHKRFGKVQNSFSSLSGMVQESVSGIRVIKAFGQEDAELKKMTEFSVDYVKQNIAMARLSGVFHPSLGLIISLSMLIVFVFGGFFTIEGKITIGEFLAFFSYLGMLIWPMIAIGWIVDMYQRGTASLKRLNSIFESVPEIRDGDDTDFSITELKGQISFKNLSFRYNDQMPLIFDDITTEIEIGKTLAVVGKTGCGKSSLVNILCRVYNPPRNSIFIDTQDIYKIPLQVLHNSMVMVPQDIFLFSDTISHNIALGKPEATQAEIETAAKYAQVHEDIMEFDQGYQTIIGERGVTLSGGQKQRVAIARALLCDSNILILDDALSAVDTKTEQNILDYLIDIRKGKTTIIIAHRISSIQHADKIIVLDEAKIVESGNHENLITLGGIYCDLVEKQKIEDRLEG